MEVADLLSSLSGISVIRDRRDLQRYARDITGRYVGDPLCVVRPSDSEALARLLEICSERSIGVVPQGGNTGLVGGAVAQRDELVLSLEEMDEIGDVDAQGSVVAEAGATLEQVRAVAAEAGLEFPLDFAARGSATVGGMIATDAAGALTMRHGTMRDRILGVKAALADGRLIDQLDGSRADDELDLAAVLPGSEGTLAIVLAARLSLVTNPKHRVVTLLALDSIGEAVSVAVELPRHSPSVEAIDFFLGDGLELVRRHASLGAPFREPHDVYLVVSCAAETDPTEELIGAIGRAGEIADSAVARSQAQADLFWSYRELHNEAIGRAGIPHKLDVAVDVHRVPELIRRTDSVVTRWTGARAFYFGHLATGAVHINLLGVTERSEELEGSVLQIVVDLGGDIAGEHGIGLAKARYLELALSEEKIASLRALKSELDPKGILNPGKLLPD